jgi:hypothetical protein
MDKQHIIEALQKSIDEFGINIINNKNRLRSILNDALPGTIYKFDRKCLLDALEIDEWKILLEVNQKGLNERNRAINVLLPLMKTNLGWTEERCFLILDCYTSAMGWAGIVMSQMQQNQQSHKNVESHNAKLNTYKSEPLTLEKQNNRNIDFSTIHQKTGVNDSPIISKQTSKISIITPSVGSTIRFGSYEWRVLSVEENRSLIITKDLSHINIPYNKDFIPVNWETCTLRKWLNENFFKSFYGVEQSKIILTKNRNENNQWYGTYGGNDTTDRIFLLSLSEVVKYFGDSGNLQNRVQSLSGCIDDEYNLDRIANYRDSSSWWWLRSPGKGKDDAANVFCDGTIMVDGGYVNNENRDGGIRPALWLTWE